MTITELAPLRTDRQRVLLELLDGLGEQLRADGVGRHEYAVQTLARATRHLTPGASASMARRLEDDAPRLHAFDVVVRVLARCGDEATHRRVTGTLARYAPAV